MKTPKEILDEALAGDLEMLDQHLENTVIHAMKEYAKMWVDRCERYSFMPKIIAEKIKTEIDNQ